MPTKLKVYGWITNAPHHLGNCPGRRWANQIRIVVAAPSIAAVRRITEPQRLWPGRNWIGGTTANVAEVAAALSKPGAIFYKWDNALHDAPYRELPPAPAARPAPKAPKAKAKLGPEYGAGPNEDFLVAVYLQKAHGEPDHLVRYAEVQAMVGLPWPDPPLTERDLQPVAYAAKMALIKLLLSRRRVAKKHKAVGPNAELLRALNVLHPKTSRREEVL